VGSLQERHFLEEFAAICPAFPLGKITDHESPDFLIEQDTKVIGVEIVDYIRGQNRRASAERRNEVLRQKIADEAKEKFEAKYNIPLLVHFFWKNRYSLRQAETSQLADSAVSVIEKYIPAQLFESIRIGSDELDETLLEKACHSITVLRGRNEKQSLWSFISSGWIEVQTDEIQYLLDSKDKKVQEYLQVCDVIWLIIVADGRYISSNIDIPSTAANNVYKTLFEQVFIFDRTSKSIFPLRIQRA
jgi:hypothetical protein